MAEMRLQKYLARAGVASRRACEGLIAEGHVSVNEAIVTEMGTKVSPGDEVRVDGALVEPLEEHVTLMLHKPAGYVTTMDDPQGRPCVAELVPRDEYPALFPVGRLDADTTGLLLFTTDGELGNSMLHPSHHVDKTYFALVEGVPTEEELERLRKGIELDDGMTLPAVVELLVGNARKDAERAIGDGPDASGNRSRDAYAGKTSCLSVTIHEGRKRQVRRMFDAIGYPIIALHRATFGPLALDDLSRGEHRELVENEVALLRTSAGIH